MRIVFGWNRIKLKSFSLQELNIETTEQTQNAKLQVSQSYFHLFWIPFFPLGKRYSLVINGEDYHIPPSMWKAIDQEQIKAKGKWYAWSLPILGIVVGIGIYINGIYEAHKMKQHSIAYAERQRAYFDHPAIGDGIIFSDHNSLNFMAEVFEVNGAKVKLLVDLMSDLDAKLLEDAEHGLLDTSPDSLIMLMNYRNELEFRSIYRDSLLHEHPSQPMYRKLLTFELERFPIKYEIVEMPLVEYKSMKKSIGDYYTTFEKAVKLPSLNKITKNKLFVEPGAIN